MIRSGTAGGPPPVAKPADAAVGAVPPWPVRQPGPGTKAALVRSLSGALASSGAGIVVSFIGRQVLPLPVGWSVRAWEQWWSSAGPLVGVFAIARVVLIVAAMALTVAFVVVAVAVATAGAGRPRMAARLSAARWWPGCGPVLRLAMAAGATGAALAGCGSVQSGPGSGRAALNVVPPAPTLTNSAPVGGLSGASSRSASGLPAAPESQAGSSHGVGGPLPPPAARITGPHLGVPAPPVAVPSPPPASPAPAPASPAVVPSPPPAPPAASTGASGPGRRVVRPGDSLWSIAEDTVGPHSRHLATYWAAMIDLNRPVLPDPANPSLLFAGDVVLLPPLPPAAG